MIVATYGTREVLGVHAETGEIMWRYPYPAEIRIGLVSTPVAVGSRLFVCGGEGKGRNFSACLQMQAKTERSLTGNFIAAPNGRRTCTIRSPSIRTPCSASAAGPKRASCTAPISPTAACCGKKRTRWTKDQNLVIADGLIFALTKNGDLVLAEASRERYRELGRVRVPIELGRPQQPTIANGRLYIRGEQAVVCYQRRQVTIRLAGFGYPLLCISSCRPEAGRIQARCASEWV